MMNQVQTFTASYDVSTLEKAEFIAAQFALHINPPLIIGLSGELGAGKTTFIRFMLRALGVHGAIKSPTYAWVESYTLAQGCFHHFDLYRLSNQVALDALGFRDYFTSEAIVAIEWPEQAIGLNDHLDVLLSFQCKQEQRELKLEAFTHKASQLLKQF